MSLRQLLTINYKIVYKQAMLPTELGKLGESIATSLFKKKGWCVMGRNINIGKRELDIVFRRDATLLIIEVKTVNAHSQISASANLTAKKIRNVKSAGYDYKNKIGWRGRIKFQAILLRIDQITREAQFKIIDI